MVLTFLLGSLLAAGPGDSTRPAPPVNKTLLTLLVNDVRSKGCQCGDTRYPPAPPVVWNDLLEKAALNHTLDMQRNNYFSHTSPNGAKASDRIAAAGYAWRTYGENIAQGFANEKEVIKGWLQSPGHCKNIMDKNAREMGVARAGTYWTQVFGSR